MRLVLFLLGLALGVAGTLAYAVFASPAEPATVSAPLPANAPITLTFSDSFLTAVLRRSVISSAGGAPGLAIPASGLRAELRDDVIVVHATVDVLGRPTESTAILRPVLRDGGLAIDVVETNLGDLPVPGFENVLGQQINARLASLMEGMPVTFTGVKVTREAGLEITCQVDLDHLAPVALSRTLD